MKLLFKNFVLVCFLSLFVLTGCGNKDNSENTKKYTEAINTAVSIIKEVDKEISALNAETSTAVVSETYRNGITKLNEQITNLATTQMQLIKDKDLTSSEIEHLTEEYTSAIKKIQSSIENIQQKQTELLK